MKKGGEKMRSHTRDRREVKTGRRGEERMDARE